jgi:hypothetical protein
MKTKKNTLEKIYTRKTIFKSNYSFSQITDRRINDRRLSNMPFFDLINCCSSPVHGSGYTEQLTSIVRRNFKAVRRDELELALARSDWTGIYGLRDVEDIHKIIIDGINAALDVVAPLKKIRVRKGGQLYLTAETLARMKERDMVVRGTKKFRVLRNKVNRLVRRDRVQVRGEPESPWRSPRWPPT